MGTKTNTQDDSKALADPRQLLFLTYYLDPKSETFSNAFQSAVKAGFSEAYANGIVASAPEWLKEKVEDLYHDNMLRKAERNLNGILDLPDKVQAMGPFGPLFEKSTGKGKKKKKGKPIMTYATSLIKIKNDASQFVAERLGRKKYAKEAPLGGNVYNILNIIAGNQRTRIARRALARGRGGAQPSDRLSDSDQ